MCRWRRERRWTSLAQPQMETPSQRFFLYIIIFLIIFLNISIILNIFILLIISIIIMITQVSLSLDGKVLGSSSLSFTTNLVASDHHHDQEIVCEVNSMTSLMIVFGTMRMSVRWLL